MAAAKIDFARQAFIWRIDALVAAAFLGLGFLDRDWLRLAMVAVAAREETGCAA